MKEELEVLLILICLILLGIVLYILIWSSIYVICHKKGNKYILRIKVYQRKNVIYENKEFSNYFAAVGYLFVSELKNLFPAIIYVITLLIP